MSSFCDVPLVTGFCGSKALSLNSCNAFLSIKSFNLSVSITSTFCSSWLVLNPSKKFTNGTLPLIADKCATPVKSITCCTEEDASIAKPVPLTA